MTCNQYLFTSESVSEGHPDKLCDRLSDEVVDAFFKAATTDGYDPMRIRVACEALATTDRVVIAGEVRGPSSVTSDFIEDIVRMAIRDIGYEQDNFHWNRANIEVLLHPQSAEIAQGVDFHDGRPFGAGDQGIMFGYACDETDAFMPAPIYYAHRILKSVTEARKSGKGGMSVLGPDAKAQLSVQYSNGKPHKVTSIVCSIQHFDRTLTSVDVRNMLSPHVMSSIPEGWIDEDTQWYINPTGKFVTGGPNGDCGLTGRKVVVDTYGGAAPNGGGAFSGKDPTKVDRSAAYIARYMAKNVVAAGLSKRCTIQLAYSIGVPEPLSFYVDLHGTGCVQVSKVARVLREVVDLTPNGIIERLGLCRAIYARTSAYGHFGRSPTIDGGFSWEKLDLTSYLKSIL